MNKPAPKEPSMDEILSSIRQIIADDDAAVAPSKPAPQAAANAPAPRPFPTAAKPAPREPAAAEPLALSADQIVTDGAEPVAALNFDDMPAGDEAEELQAEPALLDPEDIAFEADDEAEMTGFSVALEEPEAPPPPPRQAPPPAARPAPAAVAKPLLQPTTDAAVKQSFAKLSGMSMVGSGVTLDAMLRDMLRPMLKEWLDENLSGVVERMVEKEISRLSRGE